MVDFRKRLPEPLKRRLVLLHVSAPGDTALGPTYVNTAPHASNTVQTIRLLIHAAKCGLSNQQEPAVLCHTNSAGPDKT